MNQALGRLRSYGLPNLLTGAVIAVFLGMFVALVAAVEPATWLTAYLVFCLVTVLVVRVVPVEPGAILRRQASRRALVIVIAGACAAAVALSSSQESYSTLLVLFLVFVDVLLGRATQRLATAAGEAVDEWQESLRNRAHRIAYWILAAFIVGVIALPYVFSDQARGWLGSGVGVWIVLAELVFFLPAMVIAWSHPDAPLELVRPATAQTWFRRTTTAMVGLAVSVPLLSGSAFPFIPISTQRSITRLETSTSQCYSMRANETVGWFVQAEFPINATVCWNGRRAWELGGMNRSDCNPAGSQGVVVQTLSCSRRLAADGTLWFSYMARASSAVLPFVSRVVTLTVAVSKTGRLIRFP